VPFWCCCLCLVRSSSCKLCITIIYCCRSCVHPLSIIYVVFSMVWVSSHRGHQCGICLSPMWVLLMGEETTTY
jgi:hypothetical protein